MANFFDFIKNPQTNASAPTNVGVANSGMVVPSAPTPKTQPPTNPTPQPPPKQQQLNNIKNLVSDPNLKPPVKPNGQSAVKPPVSPGQDKKSEIDLMTHLTQRSNRVFVASQTKAKELKSQLVDSEHILHGLLSDNEIYSLFVELKVQPQLVEEELAKIYPTSLAYGGIREASQNVPQLSPRVKRILDNSLVTARKLGFEFISPEHILLALYDEGEGAGARILAKLGVKKEDLNKKVVGRKEGLEGEQQAAQKKKSALEEYTIDLTAKAAQGLLDPVVERSEVIERAIHILSRRTKNNPALVGEAGVGKTAIVEGLAQKIASKQVPEPLLDKRILQLDLMSIIAGASHRGDFEERMKNLIEEVKNSQGKIIMFIDEIHNIVGAGASGEGSLDASNFLKPALSRGEIQLIGATTLTEYRRYVEKDPALERRFQPVIVPEPTEEQAIKMLKAIKDKYEAFHRVKIPDEAIEAAVVLSKRYIGDRFLPDKAVDLIDEAASAVRLPLISLPEEITSLQTRIAQLTQELQEAEKKGDKVKARILRSKTDEIQSNLKEKQEEYNLKKSQTTSAVTVDLIKDIIARWTGIPVSKITSSEIERLANLEKIMHERLIDQEAAVSSVAQAVRRGKAGLKSTQRPIGSFIFLGPTGVGKTELAKTLADILFGQEEAMIRFDMTEYMEKHEVAKLLGAPPGYIGYEEGGKLTEAVHRRPYSVVLFDEVEKAHPEIFNILLQILEDGRLTDNKGKTISFKNTVVICTSNIGTKIIQDEMIKNQDQRSIPIKSGSKIKNHPTSLKLRGADKKTEDNKYQLVKDKVMEELRKFFRPELINRFDETIVFEPLKMEHMVAIVKLQLKGVGKLLEDQNIGFAYTDNAIKEITESGFDPLYGARPLRRAIQKLVENPISSLIIEQKVKPTDQIQVDFKDDNFVFNVEKTELVSEDKSKLIKSFTCLSCNNNFVSEVVKNTTQICPKCQSKKVKEIIEPKKNELHPN